ncbi:hypothetical protein DL89DRAFT_304964 [Linderina pennispora]|uniref:Xanthine/uracil permease n=1 Tax=Linderina pennispora TaxID=61395 RepID=A0A1Y1VTH6_9FUNG|nr:uncharacterized protein DL89DRAFT_304964 [Linderina pennispora]ORX64034.1 hypothetical protein DL89DRAFT_304964 [Linderina pennispora]
MGWIDNLNSHVAKSPVGRWFRLSGSGAVVERDNSKFSVEIRAGLTTFITMAYIISTNSLILTDTGGTCDCDREQFGATCTNDPAYASCLQEIKMDFITATCAICCIGCVLMGVVGNLPIALAPGMGLNAYFTYTVVWIPRHWQGAIHQGAGCRWLARLIPASLKTATAAGIGIYLAFIGLQSSAGIGLITGSSATLVELGGCPPEFRDEKHVCTSHHMAGGPTWLGIAGIIIITILMLYRVKGAILGWYPAGCHHFMAAWHAENGDIGFNFFKKVVTFHPIQNILAKFDWELKDGDVWLALITFLFGGFLNERTQDFEGSAFAFLCDSSTIAIGSILGLSPVSTFVESGAGIAEGGRTGLTSVVTGIGFFVALFFAPYFCVVPAWATGPALVSVGAMMLQNAVHVNWSYIGDAVPAFLTIIMIPFGYSIGYRSDCRHWVVHHHQHARVAAGQGVARPHRPAKLRGQDRVERVPDARPLQGYSSALAPQAPAPSTPQSCSTTSRALTASSRRR